MTQKQKQKRRLYLRRGSRAHGRPALSAAAAAARETRRRKRTAAPRVASEWTLARIAEVERWVVEPKCSVRDPSGVLTSAEIAQLLRGLDPAAKLVAVRLLSVFWDWPPSDHAALRAFARVGARVLNAERATTVLARRRVRRARARLASLGAALLLTPADIRDALAPVS